MKFTSYPNYNESHSHWLWLGPTGWKFSRHKFITSFTKGRNPSELLEDKLDGYLPYLSMDYLRGQSDPKYASPDQSFCNVDEGQTLLLWDGANAGEFINSKKGVLSSTVAWLKPKDTISANYYWYYCKAIEHEVRRSSVGMGIPHVNGDELKSLIFPEPSLSEQSNIATFLDRETGKLDTLIAKQEHLIDLLQEKRQAIISHAITKGLNPDAKMKDSGVEWLGMVPEHWHVSPLKHAIGFQEGPGILAVDFHDEGIPLLRISCIRSDFTTLNGCNYLDALKVSSKWEHFRVKTGDLLISASASMGGVSEVTPEVDGAVPYTGIIRLFPKEIITNEFIKIFVVSDCFLRQIDHHKSGSTIQHFGPSHLNMMFLALPSKDEQLKIASYIKEQLARLDTLIDKAKRAIELAKEHRTALISAAVTGKIDVRNYVNDLEAA
jgi:type I restriction enzyme S subunit